jgi:hypothetical protein
MKIILAIFAIAFTVALLVQRDNDVSSPQANIPYAQTEMHQTGGPDASVVSPAHGHTSAVSTKPSPASDDRGDGAGGDLLRAARERLDRYASAAALVRYRIVMFDSELIGTGMYQQAGQGSERRYRLELKTQLGDKPTSLLHVCDGETLWTYRERPDGTPRTHIERLDLRRVRAAQGEASQLATKAPLEELATGGLAKLIEGLRSSFRPLSADAGYLDTMPMWAIELEWKPTVLASLLSEKQGHAEARRGDLSEHSQIPERIMVYLGHEDLFPRRIEFRRRAAEENNAVGAGQGRGGEFVPAVSVEFTDVRFNEPIDPRQFDYGPASAVDVTEAFLRSRGLPIVR